MQRVALVAVEDSLRDALVRVADAGTVQLDEPAIDEGTAPGEAAQALQRLGVRGAPEDGDAPAKLSETRPDLQAWERDGRTDLLAGEAQLQRYAAGAVRRRDVAGLAGWCAAEQVPDLTARLTDTGASVVPMPLPRSMDPPTLLSGGSGLRRGFAQLVQTYGTVPYHDVDPSLWAGVVYVVMFGMMFGDVGHGLLLLGGAAMIGLGWIPRLAKLKPMWSFVAAAGLAATVFGALYGEFFGPTGVIPVLWLAPLEEPLRLLLVALAAGAVLLGLSYTFGAVNRWREGGVKLALYAPSGIAGATVFVGAGIAVAGFVTGPTALVIAGGVVAVIGVALAVVGLYAEAGGGGSAVLQAAIGGFDLVVRLGSNVVSFARLAAFGMTHAALGWVVWRGVQALWHNGWVGALAAVVLFVVGNAIAFALEALVAAVQALRLEFYELFSRVFVGEGRAFQPWRIPVEQVDRSETSTC
ncbi:ATPase [Mycobacterium sp. Y57]|nr:ATPase [Mycolicibacterium xanthum]